MSKKTIIGAAIAVVVAAYMFGTATYVEEGQEAKLTGEVAFDPLSVAKDFWATKSKDYFAQNAVDLVTLVNEANGDFKSVAGKYGHYSMGDSGELSFIVKGQGTVTAVKNKLRAGYLGLAVDGVTANDVTLQIGPVFKGSAVRDSISLLSYKDYKNQIEWANISQALHEMILSEIISPIDMNAAEGKTAEFIGSFTVNGKKIQITPVSLNVR